jgi:hypothetical protein
MLGSLMPRAVALVLFVLLRRALLSATLDRDEGASHPRKLLSAS